MNSITYTFIPLPFYDELDGQWKPSVKELRNGEFVSWQVFDLGFDEPRFTMPYANELAKEMMTIRKLLTEHWMAQHG